MKKGPHLCRALLSGASLQTAVRAELAPTKTDCSVFKCSFYQKMWGNASKATADSKLTTGIHARSGPAWQQIISKWSIQKLRLALLRFALLCYVLALGLVFCSEKTREGKSQQTKKKPQQENLMETGENNSLLGWTADAWHWVVECYSASFNFLADIFSIHFSNI